MVAFKTPKSKDGQAGSDTAPLRALMTDAALGAWAHRQVKKHGVTKVTREEVNKAREAVECAVDVLLPHMTGPPDD